MDIYIWFYRCVTVLSGRSKQDLFNDAESLLCHIDPKCYSNYGRFTSIIQKMNQTKVLNLPSNTPFTVVD